MTLRPLILAASAAFWPLAGHAMELALPANATVSATSSERYGSYRMPISPWLDGKIQSIWCEGEFTQQAWKMQDSGLTTLQILSELKTQLTKEGFETVFECDTEGCGGFDFRYETSVLPEPEMHVDLGDFRFLSAQRMGEEKPEYVSLLISRSGSAGFVQLTRIGPADEENATLVTSTKSLVRTPSFDVDLPLAAALEEKGHFILEDLQFATGSSSLAASDFTSLTELAAYLNANPDRTVALVGHTDAEGSLSGNIALSKRRASSVVQRLVDDFGVSRAQLSAEGMGFLSPRASNLTDEGRTQNRRVEVILTSTK